MEYYDAEAGAVVKCMVKDVTTTALTVPGQPGLRDCSQCGARFGVRPGSTASALECPHCHRALATAPAEAEAKPVSMMTEAELREELHRAYAAEFTAGRRS